MSYNFKVSFFDDEIQISSFPSIITKGGETHEKAVVSSSESSVSCDSDSVDSSESSVDNAFRSLRRTKQSIYKVARANDWDFFCTFTLKDSYRYDYLESRKKLCKWFNNFKSRHCKDLQYIVVPEFHKDGAIHFHALIQSKLIVPLLSKRWCNNKKYYLPLYNLGISEIEHVKDRYRVSNYICKYITKELTNVNGKQRYFRSQGLKLPEELEYLTENQSLLDFIEANFPQYQIVHSKTGEFESCYVQLKIAVTE